MTSSASGVPHALLHNLKHNKVLHERVILLTVKIQDVPYVPEAKRVETQDYTAGFYRVIIHYGFMDEVNVPAVLSGLEGLRSGLQDDGHQLLPRPADPDRVLAARNGDLAREALLLDASKRGKRDGVLQAPDQPRRRTG